MAITSRASRSTSTAESTCDRLRAEERTEDAIMNGARDVVVLSGVRTAIGRYGGGLKDCPPTELAAQVVREAVARAGVAPAEVGHVVFGNVIHTDAHDMYLARVA